MFMLKQVTQSQCIHDYEKLPYKITKHFNVTLLFLSKTKLKIFLEMQRIKQIK